MGLILATTALAGPADGEAHGWVRDAQSGAWIPDARVAFIAPPGSVAKNRPGDKTDKWGRYTIPALLGSENKKRMINLPMPIFERGPSVVKVNVDASILIVEVSKPGYRTYRGPVEVNSAAVTPLGAVVDTVYLQPENAGKPGYALASGKSVRVETTSTNRLVAKGKLYEENMSYHDVPKSLNQTTHTSLRPYFDVGLLKYEFDSTRKITKDGMEVKLRTGLRDGARTFSGPRRVPPYLAEAISAIKLESGGLKVFEVRRLFGYGYEGSQPEKVNALLLRMEAMTPQNSTFSDLVAAGDELATAWPEIAPMVTNFVNARFGRRSTQADQVPKTKTGRAQEVLAKLNDAGALYRANKVEEARAAYSALFDAKDGDKIDDFEGRLNYGRLLAQAGDLASADRIWTVAIKYARWQPKDYTELTPQELESVPGAVHLRITVPSVFLSGTVNFMYPEAASAYNATEYMDALKNPSADWAATTIVVRSLVELGLSSIVIDVIKQGLAAEPDNVALLETAVLCGRALGDPLFADSALERLRAFVPNHRLFERETKR